MELNKTDSTLRILIVEDSEHDRVAFRRTFEKNQVSCDITECEKTEEAITILKTESSSFDLVVSDYGLPGMSGLDFFKELLAAKTPLPLVLITGSGTEQTAIEALKAGVHDYIIKDDHHRYLDLLPVTLLRVVERYREKLLRIKAEEEREKLVHKLQKALDDVKTLKDLIPICAACKKIRNDEGFWKHVDEYLVENTSSRPNHAICPDCAKSLYPDIYKKRS